MKADNIVFAEFDGVAAIGATLTYGQKFRLLKMELHIDTAPTTSQDFTITLDSKRSSRYDNVIYKRDLSVGSVTDILYHFSDKDVYDAGDEIDIAYTNTDARTWGIRVAVELLE